MVVGIGFGLVLGVSAGFWIGAQPESDVVRRGTVQITECHPALIPLGGTACSGPVTWEPEANWKTARVRLNSRPSITVHSAHPVSGTVQVTSRANAWGGAKAGISRGEWVMPTEQGFIPGGAGATAGTIAGIVLLPFFLAWLLPTLLQVGYRAFGQGNRARPATEEKAAS